MGSDGFDQRISQGSDCLREGVEYAVLEIFAQADGSNKLRIEFSDLELPSLFDSRMFEVSSGEIPKSWCITANRNGSLSIGPADWVRRPGFWEAFMDREAWALELYAEGRSKSLG
ncbi:hypothetical protein [Streptomyces misionensis]|uniref:hypothetical protein n=1 Tax=Streptomyces misionensis TaxID=67331 RepID=UPI0036F6A2B0